MVDERAKFPGAVRVFSSRSQLASQVAERIRLIVDQCRFQGRSCTLGLATGDSPRGVYRKLASLVEKCQLELSDCEVFGLDEYYPINPHSPESFSSELLDIGRALKIEAGAIHFLRGDIPRDEIEKYCADYESQIRSRGGIDFQLLGIGRSGHIAFNEPGSAPDSRTRVIELHAYTRQDAVSRFGGFDRVPREALTMGIGTITEAREIVLIAQGEGKSDVVRRLLEGSRDTSLPASLLQGHPNATIYLDEAAAGSQRGID